MKENLSKKVLDKIKEEGLKPVSKYNFLIKNYILWGFGLFTMVLGALAVSVIIFLLTSQEWGIYKQIGDGFFKFFFLVIPYFWIVLFGMFVFLAYLNYKHTKFGYRHGFGIVLLIYFLLTLVLGGVLYFVKVGDRMDIMFSKNIPFYEVMLQHRQSVWQHPERGLLAGKIEKVLPKGFVLLDIKKINWLVDTKDAKIFGAQELKSGDIVGIIGEEISKGLFIAETVKVRGIRRSRISH